MSLFRHWFSKIDRKNIFIYLIMLLFSLSSAMFFPVVQSFMFQQVCLDFKNETVCSLKEAAEDREIHRNANYIMMFGSICMCAAAIYISPKVGKFSDKNSRVYAILIPFSGALIADIIFVVMAFAPYWATPYLFILGELAYGLTGGYMACLSTIFSHISCLKVNSEPRQRSIAMAKMEGTIGLGAIIGNFLAAFTRLFPYYVPLIFFAIIHITCIALTFQLREDVAESEIPLESVAENESVVTEQGDQAGINWLKVLLYATFTLSFFSMIGSSHILFFYLKQQFFWDAQGYSIFTGVIRFTSTGTALFLYPWLKRAEKATDVQLALVGLVARILAKLWMAIAKTPVVLYGAVFFESFGRFPATALRSMISVQADLREQGHAFGQIAVLEAWCNLFAALFFHVVFPWSLSFLPGLSFFFMSVILIPPTLLIWKFRHRYDRTSQE